MDAWDGAEFAALAARVDQLSQVCAQLSQENAELRGRVSRLTVGTSPSARRSAGASPVPGGAGDGLAAGAGPAGQRIGPLDGQVSRRLIGRALGAAAVGVVGAAALVDAASGPAAASDGDPVLAGKTTTAESATTVQFDGTPGPGMIFLVNDTTLSAAGSAHPAAVGGWAGGDVASGVYGFTEVESGDGVVGQVGFANSTGNGVHGVAAAPGVVGVLAENSDGVALSAICDSVAADVTAIVGTITSTNPGSMSAAVRGVNLGTGSDGIGVWGSQAGSGLGVYGSVASGIGVRANGGTGTGVSALGATGVSATGSGTTGVGVSASASGSSGRGGVFAGTAAQVQLSPGAKSTHPKSGVRGDLYADSTGRLWFCKTSGSTASWHQIA